MRPPRIYWEGTAREPSAIAMQQVKSAIHQSEGIISQCHFFSDVSVGLTIELLWRDLELMQQNLKEAISLRKGELSQGPYSPNQECELMLHITFPDGGGNVRREVPMVPG